jgi:hypothetical protein
MNGKSPPLDELIVVADVIDVPNVTSWKVPDVNVSYSVVSSPSSVNDVIPTTLPTRKTRPSICDMPCALMSTYAPVVGGVAVEATPGLALLTAVMATAVPRTDCIATATFFQMTGVAMVLLLQIAATPQTKKKAADAALRDA